MEEEIKEILSLLNSSSWSNEAKQIEDYINNLKEENERLKEENKRIFSKVNDDELLISNAMNYAEAQDYKQRTEKTIENIDLVIELIKQQPTEDDTWILNRLNGFKFILKGDKDE